MIDIHVERALEIDPKQLDPRVVDGIRTSLSFPNYEKGRAKKERQGGWWKMPDYITAYWEFDGKLHLPRGFADQLLDGLDELGLEWEIHDNRSAPKADFSAAHPVELRPYQKEALAAMTVREQGIWQAPPGAGKTVTVLELIRSLGLRALVVVDKTNIAEQWRERAAEHIGLELGLVGDGEMDVRDLTIATQQTLWSRREELEEEGFFDKWGFVCLDECHHLPALTFTDTLQRFSAKYKFGVSGTPAKKWHHLPIMEATVGNILHVTEKELLQKQGYLVKVEVDITNTSFGAFFWPTHTCDKASGKCGYSYCTRDKDKKLHRNNYQDIIKALIEDDERNVLIARQIAAAIDKGYCCLVLSKRLKHLARLKELVDALTDSDRLWDFTGKQSTEERMEIQTAAEDGSCALFATVADEALDIPRADAVFLTFPSRNTGTIRQQIGRIERPHPKKKQPVVWDYRDNVNVFRGQLRDRIDDVYTFERLTVRDVGYTPSDG